MVFFPYLIKSQQERLDEVMKMIGSNQRFIIIVPRKMGRTSFRRALAEAIKTQVNEYKKAQDKILRRQG